MCCPISASSNSDLDFGGDLHGRDGPTSDPAHDPTNNGHRSRARLHASSRELRQMPFVADMNGDCARRLLRAADEQHGAKQGVRGDLLSRCRGTAARQPDHCDRMRWRRSLLFEGRRAIGVKATVGGAEKDFRAREIVLCGGAIQSPALLMRSGIGPAAASRAMDIEVTADLPGVGQNLQNHPVLFIGAHLRPHARQAAIPRTLQFSCFRLSSGLPNCPKTDLVINVQSKSSWSALGAQIANLGPVLWKPFSRGQVTLVSHDARQYPLVEFNFVDDERDLARMKYGFRFVADLLASRQGAGADRSPVPGAFHGPAASSSIRRPRQMPGRPRSSRGCSI